MYLNVKTLQLFLICLLVFSGVFSQEYVGVLKEFEQAKSVDDRFSIFFENEDRYNLNSAYKWLDRVTAHTADAEMSGDSLRIFKYKTILSQIQLDLGDYSKSALIAEKLYKKDAKLDVSVRKKLLGVLDTSYEVLSLYDKQLAVRQEMKKIGEDVYLYDVYSNLGLHRQAMMDYTIEVESKIEENDYFGQAEFFNNQGTYLRRDGSTYNAIQRIERALIFIDLFLKEIRPDESPEKFRDAVFLKGLIQGNLGKCMIRLGQYEKAIPLLEAGASSSKKYNNGKFSFNIVEMWIDLADSYLHLNNEVVVKSYLDSISSSGQRPYVLVDYNRILAEYYLRKGDADSASYTFKEYIKLKDSINSNEKENDLLGLLVKFDLQHQKDEIQKTRRDLLKTRDEVLQRDKKINFGIFALLAALLALGAVAFAYFKSVKNKRLIQDQNKIIESSLIEKDSLLKEIHHRVKNNLQMVSSLLSMQTKNTQSQEAIEALEEGKSRVKAMALIHQKLYQNEGLSVIGMQGYIESLVNSIQSVYKKGGHDVNINIDAEGTELDIDRAIPIGLILNELVSNSFKYAFPEKTGGKIYINIRKEGEQGFFEYTDNGRGLPDDIEERSTHSMGVKLMQRLVNQLRSNLNIDKDADGARFWFNFS